MPPGRPPARSGERELVWCGLAFLLALTLRAAFTLNFPTIHGGDAAARLAHASTLKLGYQLPLPQAFVMLGKAISDDPLFVRLVFCALGGLLVSGVTALVSIGPGPRAAVFAALLLSFDPLLIHYSIVPYQESAAYGLLAWAFYFALSGRPRIGACVIAAACLSRYEAWLFLPPFVWLARSRLTAAIACVPTAGWILWWGGLAPSGLYVLDIDAHVSRWPRIIYLARKFLEYETLGIVLLAGAALVIVRANRGLVRAVAIVVGAIAVVVVFGHESPAGSGLVSERLLHLPVLLALPLAAVGLSQMSRHSKTALMACGVAVALYAGRNMQFETALLRAAESEPDLALARDVARAIESYRNAGECVTVDAPRVDAALLESYVAKVDAAFGDAARARERAFELKDASPDRDRIAAHLRARPGTIRATPGCPLLVQVDSGAEALALIPANAELVARLSAGPRRARLYRIRP